MAYEGDFGSPSDHFGITLGSLLGSLGTTLGSLWVYEGGFGPLLGHFGITLGVKGGPL